MKLFITSRVKDLFLPIMANAAQNLEGRHLRFYALTDLIAGGRGGGCYHQPAQPYVFFNFVGFENLGSATEICYRTDDDNLRDEYLGGINDSTHDPTKSLLHLTCPRNCLQISARQLGHILVTVVEILSASTIDITNGISYTLLTKNP